MAAEKEAIDLPDECWELIFKRLGHHHYLEGMSLVCKSFLSISDSLRHTLTISDPQILTVCHLSKLFRRFRHLKVIHINRNRRMSNGEINSIVVEIARSGLNHQLEQLHLYRISSIASTLKEGLRELSLIKFTKFKTLTCNSCYLTDADLVAIMTSLPGLEELDIMNSGWDRSTMNATMIEELRSALKDLRKISVRDVCVSDRSLALSHNCLPLSEVAVANLRIGEEKAGFALRHCSNLTSLSVDHYSPKSQSSLFTIENSISFARALCALEFISVDLSDTRLASIAQARLPSLKKLKFIGCGNLSFSGLSLLFHEYQSLNELTLKCASFLTDQNMNYLTKFLGNLTHINLYGCSQLTNSTFFDLARSCPLLVDIIMRGTSIGREGNIGFADLKKNSHIQCLDLFGNTSLNDESLIKIGYICPNLQKLDLSGCWSITEEGIGDILERCSSITHLIVNGSKLKMVLGKDSEHSELKIEVLEASDSNIDNNGMAMIAMRCPNLLQLKLQHCLSVTPEGLSQVLEKCAKLSEIDLTMCKGLMFGLYAVMSTTTSLRKVNIPGFGTETEGERNLSMRIGCRFCDELALAFLDEKRRFKARGHLCIFENRRRRKYTIFASAARAV